MLRQGLLLMVAGTGTVFIFLCLMVIVMMIVGAYFKANEARFREEPAESASSAPKEDLASVVAAIAVSLNMKSQSNKS